MVMRLPRANIFCRGGLSLPPLVLAVGSIVGYSVILLSEVQAGIYGTDAEKAVHGARVS